MNMSMEQKEMMAHFKLMVKAWGNASDGIYELIQVNDRVFETEGNDLLDRLRIELDDEYFKIMRTIFMVDQDCSAITNDDWFWLEWDTSDNCFWFVYGLTAPDREDFKVNKHNRMIDEQEEAAVQADAKERAND